MIFENIELFLKKCFLLNEKLFLNLEKIVFQYLLIFLYMFNT